jgi:hypothetical protein
MWQLLRQRLLSIGTVKQWRLLVESWWARFGFAVIAIKFIPALKDFFETGVFIKRHWAAMIEFLGTGYGTLATIGLGVILIIIAICRTPGGRHAKFPESLQATYKSFAIDLNEVEDHISFKFNTHNESPYELQLNEEKRGHMYLMASLPIVILRPWNLTVQQSHNRIAADSIMEFTISLILDLNLGAEFAYKDPDLIGRDKEFVEFDFSEMVIGLVGTGKRANKKSCIRFPSEIQVMVPESSHHWAEYRALYESQRKLTSF